MIDNNTGTIKLPSGLVITADLDKTGFEKSVHFSEATPYDYGTLPFQWFRFEGGQLDGYILKVNLCFYDTVLVDFNIRANFVQAKPQTWADFSPETEGKIKAFHDQLLQNDLGKPHKRISFPSGQNQPILDYRIEYNYPWGSVWSSYDSRGGFSSIGVRYGSRLTDAQEDYRKKQV
jgi:hypothetical protein